MPFCPKCRSEYLDGTKICDDCDTKLVATLSKPVHASGAGLVDVWHSYGEMDSQLIRALLDSHGIESMLSGESLRLTHGFTVDGLAEVKILVREEDATRARDIIASLDGMRRCHKCSYPVYEEDSVCHSCGQNLQH